MLVPNVNILKNLTCMHSSHWLCASDSHAFSYLNLVSQVSNFVCLFGGFVVVVVVFLLIPASELPESQKTLPPSFSGDLPSPAWGGLPSWAHYSRIFWVRLWLSETLSISCTTSGHYTCEAFLSIQSKLPLFSSLLATQISCNISLNFHCVGMKPGCHL